MAIVKCPECGKEISSYATACPNCGFPLKTVKDTDEKPHEVNRIGLQDKESQEKELERKEERKVIAVIVGVVFLLIAGFCILYGVYIKDAATNFYEANSSSGFIIAGIVLFAVGFSASVIIEKTNIIK